MSYHITLLLKIPQTFPNSSIKLKFLTLTSRHSKNCLRPHTLESFYSYVPILYTLNFLEEPLTFLPQTASPLYIVFLSFALLTRIYLSALELITSCETLYLASQTGSDLGCMLSYQGLLLLCNRYRNCINATSVRCRLHPGKDSVGSCLLL